MIAHRFHIIANSTFSWWAAYLSDGFVVRPPEWFSGPLAQQALNFGYQKNTTKMKQEARGGTRKNAGAKPLYYEPTVTVSVKCPASKAAELKEIIKILLKQLQKQKPPP